jgi:hypothetical protein
MNLYLIKYASFEGPSQFGGEFITELYVIANNISDAVDQGFVLLKTLNYKKFEYAKSVELLASVNTHCSLKLLSMPN